MINLVNTNQPRRKLKHIIPQRNNNELRVLSSLLDIRRDDGHVSEIQSRVNLIHDVQRRRLIMVQSEDEGERREGFLAAREVGDVFPGFLGRHDGEEDAFGEGV